MLALQEVGPDGALAALQVAQATPMPHALEGLPHPAVGDGGAQCARCGSGLGPRSGGGHIHLVVGCDRRQDPQGSCPTTMAFTTADIGIELLMDVTNGLSPTQEDEFGEADGQITFWISSSEMARLLAITSSHLRRSDRFQEGRHRRRAGLGTSTCGRLWNRDAVLLSRPDVLVRRKKTGAHGPRSGWLSKRIQLRPTQARSVDSVPIRKES